MITKEITNNKVAIMEIIQIIIQVANIIIKIIIKAFNIIEIIIKGTIIDIIIKDTIKNIIIVGITKDTNLQGIIIVIMVEIIAKSDFIIKIAISQD